MENGLSRKDELYNDLLAEFESKDCKFSKSTKESEGSYIIQVQCLAFMVILLLVFFFHTRTKNIDVFNDDKTRCV